MPLTDNLVLAALAAGVVLLLIALAFVLKLALRDPDDKPKAAAMATARMRPESLRTSFRTAVELIENHIAGRKQRYGVPWVLVFDDAGRDDSLGLDRAGIASSLGTDAAAAASTPGLSWHFFDQGVAVRFDGASLGDPMAGADKPEPTYDEFLGLCRDYRAQRPFDGVVVTVPAALLLADPAESRPALTRLAQRAARRLQQAQNRFAMRMTVSVVISGCERIAGFGDFARALPEAMRGSMLGWSVPYDIGVNYQPGWAREAVDAMVTTVSQTVAELSAEGIGDSDSARTLYLLPGRLDRLAPSIQLYLDELLRPSAYHDPFLWRGIYLTGDAAQASSLHATLAPHHAQPQMAVESAQFDAPFDATHAADAAHAAPNAELNAMPSVGPRVLQPSFLRDVFEAKVFPERGLTRPSGARTVEQPALHRGLRWAGYAWLGAWSIGVVAAYIGLQNDVVHERSLLESLRAEAGQRALTSDQQRDRAIALLQAIDRMDRDRLWSVFMPGSWPMFDPLHARLRTQIHTAFGEIAVTALERGLQLRAAALTGGTPTARGLDAGACSELTDQSHIVPSSLAIEALPEFAAMNDYAATMQELGLARDALTRLMTPTQPSSRADLALVVRVGLGVNPPELGDRVVQMFHAPRADRSSVALDNGWSTAAACRLRALHEQFTQRAMVENPLLDQHRDVAGRFELLVSRTSDEPDQRVADWRALLDAVRSLKELASHGGAGWMVKPNFDPGPPWQDLLTRVEATPLLGGAAAAQRMRESAEHSFAQLGDALPAASDGNTTASLAWNDKEARFKLGPDLTALADGLSQLMARPWMSPRRDRQVPDFGNASLHWDLPRLDQALATDEQEKRFRADILPRFPTVAQASIEALARRQLARAAFDQAIDAMGPAGRAPGAIADAASLDQERARLLKLGVLLDGLGGRREADQLRAVIARNALRRLHDLDETFARSEPYATRHRDLSAWTGDKSPGLSAFAVADTGQLAAYLSRQRALLESLTREASHWIALAESRGDAAQRWRALAAEVDKARDRNPNSTLAALETLITALGGEIDTHNCADRLATLAPAARNDWFSERHASLRTAVLQRCRVLKAESVRSLWIGFAQEFNRVYAGRPPFSSPGWANDAPPIDPTELTALIQRFDGLMRALGQGQAQGPAQAGTPATALATANASAASRASLPAGVRRFIEQFEKTRNFLAPLAALDDSQAPGFDVGVEFRSAAGHEVDGQNVIDWSISVGGSTLSWRDPPRPLRWEPGLPVAVSVRLAKDGPATPLGDPRQPALHVDAKTATWQWIDTWALIGLVQRQRDSDFGARTEGRSQLLRLELPQTIAAPASMLAAAPTSNPPSSGSGSSVGPVSAVSIPIQTESRARLFMRLTLTPAGKRLPLTWPGALPDRAPDWDASDV